MNLAAAMPRRPRRLVCCLALIAALAAFRAGSSSEASCARFDFAQQAAQAAIEPETAFLDLGTRAARPQLLAGWSIDELWQGKTSFVWAMGGASTIRFTRLAAEPFTLYFRCRPLDVAAGAPPQDVTILVNGTQVGVTRLKPDFQTYDLAVPAAAVRPGDNRLELRPSYFRAEPPDPNGAPEPRRLAVAWDWIGFGVKSAPARPQPQASPRAGTLLLPFRTRVAFYVQVPPGSSLRWRTVQPYGTARLGAGAALEVRVDWDGADSHALRFEQPTFAAPASLPLTNQQPVAARVSFVAWPGRTAGAETAGLLLEAPELVPPA
ncbi:MAG TPA: hypothetical protein VKY89_16880, partial [Thermoanaerobaculia bacterium]|nr:hypothetical protein [Thermoanaerobaculia bacterium]